MGTDFLYEEQEAIPVLMGAGYASIYRIGDVFQAEYLYDPYQFKIVGFLSEGNRISVASRQIELDHSIVMPSFHLNSGASVTDGLKIHYANKTSGIVKSADKTLFHETVEAILSHSEVGEYSWTVSPLEYQYEEKFQISIGQTQTFLIVTLLLMMAAEIFLSAFISKDKLEYTKVISRKNVVYGTCLFLFTGAVCIGVNLAFMLLFGIRLLRFYHFPGIGAASCGVILMNHLFCKLRNKKQKSI